jgi:hypothetical protein
MISQNYFSVRKLAFSLCLGSLFLGLACWEPKLKDAEMGCGLDPNASPKCPNRPAADAAPASPDGAGNGGAALDTAATKSDTEPAAVDSAIDWATATDAAAAPAADSATDGLVSIDSGVKIDSAPALD